MHKGDPAVLVNEVDIRPSLRRTSRKEKQQSGVCLSITAPKPGHKLAPDGMEHNRQWRWKGGLALPLNPFPSQAHLLLQAKSLSPQSQSHGSQPPLSRVLEMQSRYQSSKNGINLRNPISLPNALKPPPFTPPLLLRMRRLDVTNPPIPSTRHSPSRRDCP